MLEHLLPKHIALALEQVDATCLFELRLRAGRPVSMTLGGVRRYLSAHGPCVIAADALVTTQKELCDTVLRATDYSLYRAAGQLAESFITVQGGIRIGVCGEPINAELPSATVRDPSSLVLRFPHEVKGCSSPVPLDGSVLIASVPGMGKTTMLRDLAARHSRAHRNVVIVDERCEIAASVHGIPSLDVAECDVIANCSKLYGITHAIRAMSPDVIVTDELSDEADARAVSYAVGSGIRVVASMHAGDLDGAEAKLRRMDCSVFDRVVALDRTRVGVIAAIGECRR